MVNKNLIILAALLIMLSTGCKKEESGPSPEEIENLRQAARQASTNRDAQMRRAPEINIASESDIYKKDTTKLVGTNASTGAGGYTEKAHPLALVGKKPAPPGEKEFQRARTIEN